MYVLINLILIYEAVSCLYANREENRKPGFSLAMAFTGVLLVNNMVAMSLAVLEVYSLLLLISVLCVGGFFAGILLLQKKRLTAPKELLLWVLEYRYHKLPIFILIIASVLYFGFPTKFMIGGRDYGLYLLDGIHIAETGSMQYETDEYLNENYSELKDVLFPGYPGLFTPEKVEGMEGEPGEISPQFMPMFPSALAIGYDMAGIEGVIRVNAVIGLASLLVLYYFTKEFFSQKSAVVAMGLMVLEPAQLWGVRITETEILSQLLLFLAMYVMMSGWKKKNTVYFGWAGFLLGIGCMNRIDTYIYGVGLAVGLVYCILWKKEYRKKLYVVCGGYLVFGVLALWYGWVFSHIYIVEHWQAGVLSGILFLNVICFAVAAIVALVEARVKLEIPNIVLNIIQKKRLLWGAFGILFLVFMYAYFIRPYGSSDFTKRAMIEFCWYTSVPLVILAIYGLYRLLSNKQESSEQYFTFFWVFLASVFAYIIRPSITADHMWASRRWISANIPFIILMGAYGITEIHLLSQKTAVLLQGGLTLWVGGFMLYQSSPFIFSQLMNELDKQYELLAEKLSDDEIYFTRNEEIASYLRFLYGKRVYLLSEDKQENFADFIKSQETFNYIGKESALGMARFYCQDIEEPEQFIMSGDFLEQTVGRFPRSLYKRVLPASIYKMEYGENSVISLSEGDLQTQNGYYNENGEICADGNSGILFYGPYVYLEKGRYTFSFEIDGKSFDDTYVEIVAEAGNRVFAEIPVKESGEIKVEFEVTEPTDNIEMRMWVGENSGIVCRNLEIRQLPGQETIRN